MAIQNYVLFSLYVLTNKNNFIIIFRTAANRHFEFSVTPSPKIFFLDLSSVSLDVVEQLAEVDKLKALSIFITELLCWCNVRKKDNRTYIIH